MAKGESLIGGRVAVVEDDPIMGESLVQRLALEGYHCTWWRSGEEALAHLHHHHLDALVCDIRLPDLDGEELYRRALPQLGTTPVIFITAFGELEQAVRLMRAGADDFLVKPFPVEKLLGRLATLRPHQGSDAAPSGGEAAVLGASEAMRRLEVMVRRVADIDSPILICGETGTGKEYIARHAHAVSTRRDPAFSGRALRNA